ncbi:hypothetical protein P9A57_gp13 [Pseudomonas phage phiH1]|uniref:Uncharacterized protein n=1 Tax=Pseudomonas phage phiH1 TaxID=2982871 RepID=A0AAX3D178_9CAUD|nr:hypothetical protein P9A57_gp13 [Pseudomonas phage phiH1]UYD21579.1 hypothetical protein [Pseudomonas phage phiH1]
MKTMTPCGRCGNVGKPPFVALGLRWCGHCGSRLMRKEKGSQ